MEVDAVLLKCNENAAPQHLLIVEQGKHMEIEFFDIDEHMAGYDLGKQHLPVISRSHLGDLIEGHLFDVLLNVSGDRMHLFFDHFVVLGSS